MKYNPKRNERIAAMAGVANLHPYQSDESHQGMLELLFDMQNYLAAIAGLDAVSLQPAAGAHGELAALHVRRRVLPRPQGAAHARCSFPTAPTAPTRPAR